MSVKTASLPTAHRPCLDDLLPPLLLLTTLALAGGVMLVGDALVFEWKPAFIPRSAWALLDSPVHAALALLVVAPLVFQMATRRGQHSSPTRLLARAGLTGLLAVFIDLDHFVAAGSFSVAQAITLAGGRPDTHSLLLALGCGLLALTLTRSPVDGWLVFAALASHILRDAASGGTPLLWPLPFDRLSPAAYYTAELGLALISRVVSLLWIEAVLAPQPTQRPVPPATPRRPAPVYAVSPFEDNRPAS